MNVNPDIFWKSIKGKEVLNFTFRGTLTHNEAEIAIKTWKEMFQLKPNKQVIVWECKEMKGYEPMYGKMPLRSLKVKSIRYG